MRKVEFGNVLKRLRKEKKLTQIDVAKKLEVTQNVISRYESSEIFPTFDVLTKLADLFEVNLDELVYDAGPAAEQIIEENKSFLEDLDADLSLEELISKYNILIDGRKATIEEAQAAIDAIRYERFKKEKERS